ncbi:MAG: LPXTG cell wall anchor domain-containing protein [Lachnospiraceae bacterium]|nr:LPXTG cell wall anchor domain-containing protein [Lachnospiraceae bacterium]
MARTGTFQFTNLPAGYYKIEEAKYPGGYIKTIDGIKFRIEMNETTSRLEVQLENAANTVSNPDGRSVLIGNTPGAALPNTGGPGTTITYLIGLLLTSIGAVLVMLRKRKYSL